MPIYKKSVPYETKGTPYMLQISLTSDLKYYIDMISLSITVVTVKLNASSNKNECIHTINIVQSLK